MFYFYVRKSYELQAAELGKRTTGERNQGVERQASDEKVLRLLRRFSVYIEAIFAF